jgi:two-component system nitrate/nitrite response regulator NarL
VLTHALQRVLAGAVYLPDQVVSALAATPPPAALTPRQQQVLQGLSRGLPTKLIARELDLSEHTVKEYIAIIFQALGVHNRTEAVIKASQLERPKPSPIAQR